ncbi:uncharacterized protein LOC134539535 isoform X2 [Bacillus rossius redtenbacheri]|uniref:uncharacterized protein LOC134539535 isoform X2 n=1 Tax=Bacillus rossius redtenbacheri TaxID=93214 RepID=UPI002FDD3119
MKLIALVCLCLLAVVTAQDDFPFSNFLSSGSSRENRGPVLFPPGDLPEETSGVIPGASGYGFVPPGSNRIGGRGYGNPRPKPGYF